ncbi:hypothetical protein ACFVKB_20530 [Rhodococcus sp. NPDC127530]
MVVPGPDRRAFYRQLLLNAAVVVVAVAPALCWLVLVVAPGLFG